jgi:hypothetical protein
MSWTLLVGTIAVVAITAVYFLWVRKLPAPTEQPKQPS